MRKLELKERHHFLESAAWLNQKAAELMDMEDPAASSHNVQELVHYLFMAKKYMQRILIENGKTAD